MPRGFRGFLVAAGAFVTAGFRFPGLAFAELMFSVNLLKIESSILSIEQLAGVVTQALDFPPISFSKYG